MKSPIQQTVKWRTSRSSLVMGSAFFSLLLGCSDSPTGPNAAIPSELVLAADHVLVESLKELFEIGVQVLDQEGQEIPAVPLEWTMTNEDVVEPVGGTAFRSEANGVTTLMVSVAQSHTSLSSSEGRQERLQGYVNVTVSQKPVALAVGVASPSFVMEEEIRLWALGEHAELSAWSIDALGNPVSPVHSTPSWTSTGGSVATVLQDGEIIATGDGTTVITASSGGLLGSVPVKVEATLTLSACANHSAGSGGGTEEACGEKTITVAKEGY